MIDAKSLSYRAPTSQWVTWEFTSTCLTALAIGLLTTIISYQLTSIIFDLLLCSRRKNVSRVSAMHTMLLVRQSSVLAVLSNLLRKEFLTLMYYKFTLPKDTHITRDKRSVKKGVCFRLLVLLCAAPLGNIAALMLTLESERTLSFSEAGFGGAQFGINDDLSVLDVHPFTEFCNQTPIDAIPRDTLLVRFLFCQSPIVHSPYPESSGMVAIHVALGVRALITVRMGHDQVYGYQTVVLDGMKRARGGVNFLKFDSTKLSADSFVNLGIRMLTQECGAGNTSTAVEIPSYGPRTELLSARHVPCGKIEDSKRKAYLILRQLMRRLTILNSDKINVADNLLFLDGADWGDFVDASSFPMLRRRRKFVEIPVLAIIAVSVVLLRLGCGIILNNDVGTGIERVVKQRLGLHCCDFMLPEGEKSVSFNEKLQFGSVSQNALTEDELPPVYKSDHGEG